MKKTIQLLQADQVIRLTFEFCIQCGSMAGIGIYDFEQREDNPVAQFAKLGGDVSLVAERLLNKEHKIQAPFCRSCFDLFSGVSKRRQIFSLVFVTVILLTILTAMYVGSVAGMSMSVGTLGVGIFLAICVRIYARIYAWKNSPKIRKVNRKKIVLTVPGQGKIVCYR